MKYESKEKGDTTDDIDDTRGGIPVMGMSLSVSPDGEADSFIDMQWNDKVCPKPIDKLALIYRVKSFLIKAGDNYSKQWDK